MIPLTLQIKNFLSYGSEIQTIEFGSYPLICFSGKNGHGKSALLDAITWTLWGQARKISGTGKADQGLLRLGQTQMMVCLDFICTGQTYRIRREYMQTYGKPIATLDFGILDRSQDRFISLTEKTIRDTQAKIEQMLHLTFDGFINSAFLRQGQSNEFSKKSPKERKDVLAAILGLDRYELVRRLAAERIKHISLQTMHITAVQQKLEQELLQEATVEQKLREINQHYQELLQQEIAVQENQQLITQEKEQLAQNRQQQAMLQFKQQQMSKEQLEWRQQLQTIVHQWRSVHKQHLQQTDYKTLERHKQELLNQIKEHQDCLQKQLTLKQELLNQKEIIAQFNQDFFQKKSQEINTKKISLERLIGQKEHFNLMIKETTENLIKNTHQLQTLQNEYASAQQQIMPSCAQEHDMLEKRFEKRKEHYQRWIAQANMLSSQLHALERKNLLTIDQESPSCPLCEQNLSASRKRFLKKKFDEETNFLKQRITRLTVLIKNLKTVLIADHQQQELFKKQKQEAQAATFKIDELGKAIEKQKGYILELENSCTKYQELLAIVQVTLAHEQKIVDECIGTTKKEFEETQTYRDYNTKIKYLEEQLERINYNQQAHEHASKNLAHIEQTVAMHQHVEKEKLFQQQRFNEVQVLCKNLKDMHKHLLSLQEQLKQYDQLAQQEQAVKAREEQMQLTNKTVTQKKEQLLQERGSLENQKKKLAELHADYQKNKHELTQAALAAHDYQAIALATGKDGIQALLIEDAIPEIEHETNQLLAKLTDNQTQLFIESLRDLKKGGTKETLDIKISDAAGIRPYELFSGGEAFRIDFALRIAISKLLARRAGTSLQTLIIDEGFGSQDEEGLSHIMDALYKIQDDFAKIIIVSHLASMKNQFPVHFVIEKGPHGSIVNVFEQG